MAQIVKGRVAPKVFAEMSADAKHIEVYFSPDPELIKAAKAVHGYRFISRERVEKGQQPHWRYPAEVTVARSLRDTFGEELRMGRAFKVWAQRAVHQERQLGTLGVADDAELTRLPIEAPDVAAFVESRKYQKADIAFMAAADNPLNANAPGLGKTIEIIGSVYEAGLAEGFHLILAPVTSLESVWADELLHPEHGQDLPVIVAKGSVVERMAAIQDALNHYKEGKPFWLICNPAMIQMVKQQNPDGEGTVLVPRWPVLFTIEWTTVTVDEFHKAGVSNPKTMTRKGLDQLRSQRRIASSGTPIGGKAVKLWGVLNWLEPAIFPSKWRWAGQWLTVTEKITAAGTFKSIEDIKPGLEEEFYKAHAKYMVRRTKEEVRAYLPKKLRIDVWCSMGDAQRSQYERFSRSAELRIEDEKMNAIGILAEYMRLKQFSIATQRIEGGKPHPTEDSCKLDQVWRILAEHGVTGDEDDDGTEQIIIFSQFKQVIDMMTIALGKRGINVDKLTGDTKQDDRTALIRSFNSRQGPRVLLMTTTAGGVAITLNASEAIIFMDETWVPDDQDQAEDRNRENTATIYYLRTKNTIEEDILGVNLGKRHTNQVVLDIHRKRLREIARANGGGA